jgi:hypothetical protein
MQIGQGKTVIDNTTKDDTIKDNTIKSDHSNTNKHKNLDSSHSNPIHSIPFPPGLNYTMELAPSFGGDRA